jgi:hypothetical protein
LVFPTEISENVLSLAAEQFFSENKFVAKK